MGEDLVASDDTIEAEIAKPVPESGVRHAARTKPGIVASYALLAAILALSVGVAAKLATSTVRVEHVYTDRPVSDAGAVARSLTGKQVVDGSQLGLPAGTVCYFGKNATGVFVVCPSS